MKPQPDSLCSWPEPHAAIPERSRPIDGMVVGLHKTSGTASPRGWVRDAYVVMAPPGEGVADFFLEDEPAGPGQHRDPVPWVCRGVTSDGSLVLGSVNLEGDRFLSEIFSSRGED